MPLFNRSAFWQGCQDFMPLFLGVLPFGLVAGANGIALGMSPDMVLGMSIIFFSGSAQLVSYQLIQENAPLAVIWFTAVVINLRFAIYSAAFAPLLAPLKRSLRWGMAYLLSDQAYGLCSNEQQAARPRSERFNYLAGVAIAMWASWVLAVVAGITLGAGIPASWSLEFTIPLAFLAMLVLSIKSRIMLWVALVSGGSATLLQVLPYNLGFMCAVLGGVAFGLLLLKRLDNRVRQEQGEHEQS